MNNRSSECKQSVIAFFRSESSPLGIGSINNGLSNTFGITKNTPGLFSCGSADYGTSDFIEVIIAAGALGFIWFIVVDEVVDIKSKILVHPLSNVWIFHKVGSLKFWSDVLFDDQVGPSGVDDIDILKA